jgi:hypothetical protein
MLAFTFFLLTAGLILGLVARAPVLVFVLGALWAALSIGAMLYSMPFASYHVGAVGALIAGLSLQVGYGCGILLRYGLHVRRTKYRAEKNRRSSEPKILKQ